jgi:hypothetical protein
LPTRGNDVRGVRLGHKISPFRRIQIYVSPLGLTQLARPHKDQGSQAQSAANSEHPLIAVYGA